MVKKRASSTSPSTFGLRWRPQRRSRNVSPSQQVAAEGPAPSDTLTDIQELVRAQVTAALQRNDSLDMLVQAVTESVSSVVVEKLQSSSESIQNKHRSRSSSTSQPVAAEGAASTDTLTDIHELVRAQVTAALQNAGSLDNLVQAITNSVSTVVLEKLQSSSEVIQNKDWVIKVEPNEDTSQSVEEYVESTPKTSQEQAPQSETTEQIKRKVDEIEDHNRVEEVYRALRSATARDEWAVYGEFIANDMRKLPPTTQIHVKHIFANVLFKAAMGEYEKEAPAIMAPFNSVEMLKFRSRKKKPDDLIKLMDHTVGYEEFYDSIIQCPTTEEGTAEDMPEAE